MINPVDAKGTKKEEISLYKPQLYNWMPQYKTKMQKLEMKRASQTQEWSLFVAIDVAVVKKNIQVVFLWKWNKMQSNACIC